MSLKHESQRKSLFKSLKIRVRRLLFNEVLVLGDSHSKVFNRRRLRKGFPGHFFTVCAVGGATVSGLQNPNSKTQAMPIFREALATTAARYVIVLLGEVDVGFVIWYRAEKYQETVERMLEQVIRNYQGLLLEIAERAKVICVSAALPTIVDDQNWGDVANQRRKVKATLNQRIDLTLEFNRQMQEFCEANGFIYLACDDDVLNEDRRVSEEFRNPNPLDHHYNYDLYADLIWNKLKGTLR